LERERTDTNSPVGGEERELLSDQIRNILIDEIASGALPPGMGLDEQQLADRFGSCLGVELAIETKPSRRLQDFCDLEPAALCVSGTDRAL
jgi:hypothetical protein